MCKRYGPSGEVVIVNMNWVNCTTPEFSDHVDYNLTLSPGFE